VAGKRDSATEIIADAPAVAAARSGAPTGSLIGRSLGKFTVIEQLGKGGSGEVYRAEQVQLGRSAVIKVLRREVAAAPNKVERFLREAKLASRLDHPYAAHVYAFGAETDGVLWIAMEHVKGVTLDELILRRGAMPAGLFAPLFGRLCEVVHTAHELGIVHRDIKGSNVMVIERAGQLLPKLLDFGIAKGDGDGVSPGIDAPGLTGHGSTLGSPHYMSPEQWSSPGDVDARADIYALGVLAYRCVAGELPFAGIDRAGLPQAHLELKPPVLSSSVPVQVAQTIERALAKQRDARWPSALAFGEAMSRAVGGATPEAVPIFDPASREIWIETGPQPIADAVARLASATTTVEADAALRELVAITCRWLAVLALAQLPDDGATPDVREKARAVVGRDNGAPWLWLARSVATAIDAAIPPSTSEVTEEIPSKLLPELRTALAGSEALEALADRLDDRDRSRTLAALTADIANAAAALRPLEALLAYRLVVGAPNARLGGRPSDTSGPASDGAESWQGVRKRNRERVVVWGEPLAPGQVALLDASGTVVVKLSPLVQVIAPLPSSEPELFFLWRSGKGQARLVAAPWGFERDDDDAAQRLSILTTEDGDTLADTKDDRSPYPGLASYGVADAERFVGREREIEALANRLVRAPLIAVLGPSGAGKSSFIHAGVMARLSEHYELLTMRPGRHPLHTLAALPAIGTETEDSAGIVERLRAIGERAPRGLVIVIDQLEELVTLCTDPEERTKFAETLAAATSAGSGSPVRVIVTLRDDFASVIESEAAFRGRFDVFVLATPLPEALRRIVIEPARRAQVSVDPRVVDDMVAEVAGRPASLPLLSFTASQLWASRDRSARRITHDAYLALGGVAGALATYADQIYGSMSKHDQDIVRDLFARLVASDGTRIPAPREELDRIPGTASVLANLIDARLLVVREDDGASATDAAESGTRGRSADAAESGVRGRSIDIVEIVHECLAERWPRLARWRSEDAADRALLGDVRAATRRWIDAERRSDLLWHGKALLELRLLASRSGALTDDERAFLAAADGAEKRARRVRRIIVGVVMVALAGVAVVMAYLGLAANKSRAAAEQSAGQARTAAGLAEERLTAGLVAQGRRELNDNRGLAALAYFAEALRRGADSTGLRLMIAIASRGLRDEVLVLHGERVFGITALPDSGFAIGTTTGNVGFFDAKAKRIVDVPAGVGEIGLLRVRGDKLIAIARAGIAVLDLTTRSVLAKLPEAQAQFADLGPGPDEITLLTDESVVIIGFDGKERRKMDFDFSQSDSEPVFGKAHVFTADGEAVRAIDLHAMKVRVIAEEVYSGPGGSGDGSTIFYVDRTRTAHILDGTGKELRTIKPHQRTEALYSSYDGTRLGAIGDRLLTVYDRSGKELHAVPMSPQDEELLIRLRDDDVWTGSTHGVIRHYKGGTLVASSTTHTTEIEDIRIAGDHVISVGFDATIVVQKADSRQLVLDTPPCKAGSYQMSGMALGYLCEDGVQHVYIGRHEIGTITDRGVLASAYDPVSKRAAITAKEVTIFEKGVPMSAGADHRGLVAFEDSDHLLSVTGDDIGDATPHVWRYAIPTKTWTQVTTFAEEIRAIQGAAGGVFFGTKTHVFLWRAGTELHRVETGAPVEYLSASANGAVVSAHLEGGATLLIDGKTGAIDRRLEPVESFGVSAILDGPGDLVVRTSRGTLTIWERRTGDNLVWNLEFLRGSFAAAFSDDGKIEIVGERVGLIDIPRETRPISEILATIECRVPLRVAGSRLEAAPVHCR
jgi:tRNA A-37 threonylcarbamoyl transferase component Bud32